MTETMPMDQVIMKYVEAVDQGRKSTIQKLRPFVDVYLQLIGSGVDPKKARRIMDLYIE